MTDYVNNHLSQYPFDTGRTFGCRIVPAIQCADGLRMSVQASENHYCGPRESGLNAYYEVEVGFPSERVEELMPYAEDPEQPTETVYGYVPLDVVNMIIKQHGGIKE